MRKRHTYKERMKYMRMLEEGSSINFINKHAGYLDLEETLPEGD